MTKEGLTYLTHIRRRHVSKRLIEAILWSIASGCLAFGITYLKSATSLALWIVISLSVISCFFTVLLRYSILSISNDTIVQYLNSTFPSLENSADLFLKDDAVLTDLQRIQKQKVTQNFHGIYSQIKTPNHLVLSLTVCIASIVFAIAMNTTKTNLDESTRERKILDESTIPDANLVLPVAIDSFIVSIIPPDYTKIKPVRTSNPSLKIPEGSKVAWNITFNGKVQHSWITFAEDSLPFVQGEAIAKTFRTSTFYQVGWQSNNEMKLSDFYPIIVIRDEAPTLKVKNLEQFTEISIDDNPAINVSVSIKDDYGLKDAYIIATVSKGSGEAVKFREEKISFTRQHIAGKEVETSTSLNLKQLAMDAGDELYFYIEAVDNKTPAPNRARTETFFIQIRDTVRDEISFEGGLGVDLMPEYFRSQRQIIIDSEKLLRERKSLTAKEFNQKSNELGYDQKVLRLKYGEFLGEEFESGIGPASSLADSEHDHESKDVLKELSHQHDTENEHNHVPEKNATSQHDGHDHHRQETKTETGNPLEQFAHVHDDPEEATFFTQSIRAKLKAALAVMWDAELHLRLNDPARSLPFQYKALKLLKEISNDSRIYVHRTGFDAPPIKEEKRLTGDLSEIGTTRNQMEVDGTLPYPKIREALRATEEILARRTISIKPHEKESLTEAARELAKIALEQPGKFLEALSLIKSIQDNEIKASDLRNSILQIRMNFWMALPYHTKRPGSLKMSADEINKSFLDELEKLKR